MRCASEGLRLRLTRVFYMQSFSVEERQTRLALSLSLLSQRADSLSLGFEIRTDVSPSRVIVCSCSLLSPFSHHHLATKFWRQGHLLSSSISLCMYNVYIYFVFLKLFCRLDHGKGSGVVPAQDAQKIPLILMIHAKELWLYSR